MKAVLFDLDGTLIDSFEGIGKSAQYALESFGIHVEDWRELRFFVGPPLLYTYKKRYNFTDEQAVAAVDKYRERYQTIGQFECALYPGVEDCIRTLKAAGYRIGMASSKPEVTCKAIMEHFGLKDLFDDIVGATLDARIDTKEQVLAEVKRRWKDLDNSDMCLIGDTIFDVEGAVATGIPCIAVSYGFGDIEEMKKAGAAICIDSLMELPEILKKL